MFWKVVAIIFIFNVSVFADSNYLTNPTFIELKDKISTIKTISADLVHEVGGKKQNATLHFSSPKKLKIDYPDLTVLAREGVVIYYDKIMNQKTQFFAPKGSFFDIDSPSALFTNMQITNFNTNGNSVELTVLNLQSKVPEEYKLLFTKINNDFILKKIEISTQTNKGVIKNNITFDDLKINNIISNSTFTLPNSKIDSKLNI